MSRRKGDYKAGMSLDRRPPERKGETRSIPVANRHAGARPDYNRQGGATKAEQLARQKRVQQTQRRILLLDAGGATLPEPDAWSVGNFYNLLGDNGAAGDVTNLFGYMSQNRSVSMAWSSDGTILTVCSSSSQNSFTVPTPWDPSSIAASGAELADDAQLLAFDCGFSTDGDYYWHQSNSDTVYVAPTGDGDFVAEGNIANASSSEAKSGAVFSFGGAADGPAWVTRDGAWVYYYGNDTAPVSGNFLRNAEMSTPWNLDTATFSSENGDVQADTSASPNVQVQSLHVTDDGTQLYLYNGTGGVRQLWKGTMTVGHDLTTLTWGTPATIPQVDGTDVTAIWLSNDFTRMWGCCNRFNDPVILEFDLAV